MTTTTLDIRKAVREIQELYKEDYSQQTFNALVMGGVGVGKTVLIETMRKPILVYSFDPGGTKSLKRSFIDSGEIILSTASEDIENQDNFKKWEQEFMLFARGGGFQHFGTVVIDSFTSWLGSLCAQVSKNMGRKEGVLALQDWQPIRNTIRTIVRIATTQPCDFMLTAHLSQEKDDVTGRFIATIAAPPSLQQALPILFDEIYVMEAIEKSNSSIERTLLTASTGKYQCRTRIGRDKFDLREPANILNLLKKAGLPTSNKEPVT